MLVVLVKAFGGLGDGEVVEEFLCQAGVFTSDAIHAPQHIERPEGDIAEIADGGSDKIEAGGEGRLRREGIRRIWHSRTS